MIFSKIQTEMLSLYHVVDIQAYLLADLLVEARASKSDRPTMKHGPDGPITMTTIAAINYALVVILKVLEMLHRKGGIQRKLFAIPRLFRK